uniref:DENN/MADD domain containing 6B n=1 Tax=Oncorhynchus mykiss TaxID=8022 RepID=A0A8C7PWU5_ONCMY
MGSLDSSESRLVESENTESSLPWARFSSWLECVCVVTFDLGQARGCLGDTQFSFRLHQSVGRRGSWFVEENAYSRDAPLTSPQRALAHFYGYVYFRQVEDASSLVLVSRLPYAHLFQSLLQIIAPEYFEKLEPCLEAVCNEIDQWQSPVPGLTLNLPVMGVVMQVRIPSKNDKPGGSPVKQAQKEDLLPAPMMLSTIHELDLLKCFQSFLIHLQILWELMLIGEAMVILAPSPTVSSETVLALASSIAPLQYCCDYSPNVILGVTNPFFIKTFQSWPHIIHLGELKMSGDLPVKVKKLAKLKTLDTKSGIYTAHKMFLQKEKSLIKRILKGIQRKRPSEVQSAILRRHLLELTQSFIIPLNTTWSARYPEFMGTLEYAGPRLTSVQKGDWVGLRKFFRSPNFDGWYQCLHLEVVCDADLLGWTKGKSEVELVDLVLKLRGKLISKTHQYLPVKEGALENLEGYLQTIINSVP